MALNVLLISFLEYNLGKYVEPMVWHYLPAESFYLTSGKQILTQLTNENTVLIISINNFKSHDTRVKIGLLLKYIDVPYLFYLYI